MRIVCDYLFFSKPRCNKEHKLFKPKNFVRRAFFVSFGKLKIFNRTPGIFYAQQLCHYFDSRHIQQILIDLTLYMRLEVELFKTLSRVASKCGSPPQILARHLKPIIIQSTLPSLK